MIKTILTTAIISASAVTAQAQMAFEGGEVSVNTVFATDSGAPDFAVYGLSGNTSVSFGNLGLQVDIGYSVLAGSGIPSSINSTTAGLHAYYKLNDGLKIGAYYAYETLGGDGLPPIDLNTYGAEILYESGKFAVDLAVGGFSANVGADDAIILSADGFYKVSDALELNVGVWSFMPTASGPDDLTVVTVGAEYSLANMPLALGVNYSQGFGPSVSNGSGTISAVVSYSFGANPGLRRFNSRSFDYLELIMLFPGG